MDGFGADHGGYEPGRNRRPNRRNTTDIGTTYVHWLHGRRSKYSTRGFEVERPAPSYVQDMLPPAGRLGRAVDSIPARHLHSSLNKIRHPVNVVRWTPEGRRLLTASTSGEFTLWNGTGFNFETIMQAHDSAVRAVVYAHNDEWLLSADQEGAVKYWQTNFNNVKSIQAHEESPIRDLSFAPTDSKFVTASDDTTLKIFDFATSAEQSVLKGHSWDVKCVDWHPTKGLLVSGSKDHHIKLWDPRTGNVLTTLHGHKNTVAMTKFEPTNGVLLASCAREQTVRVFDIRMMRDVFHLKGHEKEVSSIVWHPIHSSMLTTGGGGGAMFHYLLDEQHAPQGAAATVSPYDSQNPSEAPAQFIHPAHQVPFAHEYAIWSMDWHPLGHILASGSNDKVTRFWTRPRPGDTTYAKDRWHIGQTAAEAQGTWRSREMQRQNEEETEADEEADGLVDQKMPGRAVLPGLPGLAAPAMRPHPDGTSMGGAQTIDLPGFANSTPPFPIGNLPAPPPGFDLAKLMEITGGQLPLPPTQNGLPAGFPPMPPGFPTAGMSQPPPGWQPPAGFPLPPGGLPGMVQTPTPPNTGNGVRRRGPLPSQQDSLKEEMRQGRYTKPR